ncbi:hypothetical protein NDU88_007091 [Pleurodeles waltl]|uniref:Uncharacterized protein n=1 Tax=Pleurodeles waltl TaxID=8319 RepID=A0AAV7QKR2_PLEWA|nr:hypothetical protein NDU88_007091 [Pleurodeles waltl]
MLSRPTSEGAAGAEGVVTRFFMEALFMSLKDDLQSIKKELAQGIKARTLPKLDDRVLAPEDKETSREEEVAHLRQEVLRLQEQHIDLQSHAEDLENRPRCNNIRIRGVPSGMENEDVESYVQALFTQILGRKDSMPIWIDRAHRVGSPRSRSEWPADILILGTGPETNIH